MGAISVLISDSSLLVSDALAKALHLCHGFEVHDEFPTAGPDALEAVGRLKPDIALIDYWLRDMQGPALTALIRKHAPETKVSSLSWIHSPNDIDQALASGAAAFLPKSLTLDTLADAIRRVHNGEWPVYAEDVEGLVAKLKGRGDRSAEFRLRLAALSPRELTVLKFLGFGRSIQWISSHLGISQSTVKVHIHNVVRKADVRTKEEALAMARHCGLIRT